MSDLIPTTDEACRVILQEVQYTGLYQKCVGWGEPRSGHPEGKIVHHIAELEENLARLLDVGLGEEREHTLRLLIHVHDLFKGMSASHSPIVHPQSHASMAREFISPWCGMLSETKFPGLLSMLQYHDEPYAIWRKYRNTPLQDVRQSHTPIWQHRATNLRALFNEYDWRTFRMFLVIDNCTEGKQRDPLEWYFRTDSEALEWMAYCA